MKPNEILQKAKERIQRIRESLSHIQWEIEEIAGKDFFTDIERRRFGPFKIPNYYLTLIEKDIDRVIGLLEEGGAG